MNCKLASVSAVRGITLDLLQDVVESYDPNFLTARLIMGHADEEVPALGVVKSIRLEGEDLWGELDLSDDCVEMIRSKKLAYVSIELSCYYLDSLDGVDISDDEEGELYKIDQGYLFCNMKKNDGTVVGAYLDKVALLGSSNPGVKSQPLLWSYLEGKNES